jgi:TDG/mug DNA glycosylase family protein
VSACSGHQVVEEWLGQEVVTLADLIPSPCRIMVVGINPAPTSVDIGHYYQGQLGQRFLARLRQVGLLPGVIDGYEDDTLVEAGVGLTDLVKRPTRRGDSVTTEENWHGRRLLEEKIRTAGPEFVIFTFKAAAKAVLGSFEGNGWVPGLTLGGAEVFVMPGPVESRERAQASLASLASRLKV